MKKVETPHKTKMLSSLKEIYQFCWENPQLRHVSLRLQRICTELDNILVEKGE